MGFEEYLNINYKNNLEEFNKYCYKQYGNKLDIFEIEDIYSNSILNVLQSKSHLNNKVLDYNSYFWITLRNDTVFYLKNKYKPIKIGNEKIPITYINISDSLDLSIDDNEFNKRGNVKIDGVVLNRFKEGGYIKLVNKLKEILTPNQYYIFMNMINNDIKYKDVADIIGYSVFYISHHKKIIWKKIKEELGRNGNEYFDI